MTDSTISHETSGLVARPMVVPTPVRSDIQADAVAEHQARVAAALEMDADAIAAARLEASKLEVVEADWARRVPALREELRSLRAGAGEVAVEAALAGASATEAVRPTAERSSRIQAELETIAAAVRAVRGRRVAALRAIRTAEGNAIRGAASALRAEADQHQAKTDELLGALEAWEGARYVAWEPSEEELAQLLDQHSVAVVPRPRTWVIRAQANLLDGEADAREARSIHLDDAPAEVSADDELDWIQREHGIEPPAAAMAEEA